jgi:hypothetical protein
VRTNRSAIRISAVSVLGLFDPEDLARLIAKISKTIPDE